MTRPAFLVFVSVRALAATAALMALAAALASCGDAEEEVGPDTQPSPITSSPSPIAPTATPVVTTEPSPAPVPTGWQIYVDAVLGFSFAYPLTLTPTDLTGPMSTCCADERVVVFRPTGTKAPGLSISVTDASPDVSVREWARVKTACNLDTPPGSKDVVIGGRPGLICMAEPMDDRFENGAVIKDGARMIYATSTLTEAEFAQIIGSIRFAN